MQSNSDYAKQEYWDDRFKEETEFEWLCGFDVVADILLPILKPNSKILHIGCGSSHLSMRLYEAGFCDITNVDYSQILIDSSLQRYAASYPEMKWICDDMLSLNKIESNAYDVVLEKATIEALLVKEKSPWCPSDEALVVLDQVFSSVTRVLRTGGVFISISFTQPHFRVPALMRNPNWSINVEEFGTSFHYYVYLLKNGEHLSSEIRERYGKLAADWLRPLN
ncbi:unnamed protein product, partial [Mesorhabditis belari]|uniref:Methyltransferase domain-containing protein n=1 Tax=Mesorhabditis belari TaxID=2138241 RepID=A0AAF3FDU2_9BILA